MANRITYMNQGHQYFDEKMWIKFNQLIAQNISLDAAIFFGHLYNIESYLFIHKSIYFKSKDYWFICKREDVLNKINMCYSRQRKCIEELEKFNLIETQLRQNKLKWFRINWEEFINKRDKWYQNFINIKIEQSQEYKEYEKEINDDNW